MQNCTVDTCVAGAPSGLLWLPVAGRAALPAAPAAVSDSAMWCPSDAGASPWAPGSTVVPGPWQDATSPAATAPGSPKPSSPVGAGSRPTGGVPWVRRGVLEDVAVRPLTPPTGLPSGSGGSAPLALLYHTQERPGSALVVPLGPPGVPWPDTRPDSSPAVMPLPPSHPHLIKKRCPFLCASPTRRRYSAGLPVPACLQKPSIWASTRGCMQPVIRTFLMVPL